MNSVLPLLALAAGCAKSIYPSTSLGPPSPIVVGGELTASGSWSGTCKENLFDAKHDPTETPCDYKPVRIEVECKGACDVEEPAIDEGEKGASLRVFATKLGRAGVRISNTRTDTGAKDVKAFYFEVVAPERLALECEVGTSHMPCGPEGVSAQNPLVYPQIFVLDHEQWSHQLMINGKQRGVSAKRRSISLADLFPEARDGDGIKPGTYLVELSLAGVSEKFQVVAR